MIFLENLEILNLRRKLIDNEFKNLNDRQREAVYTTNGPLLILAGAGSGKTTVLVNRIANLIKFGSAYDSNKVYGEISADDLKEINLSLKNNTSINFDLCSKLAVSPAYPSQILAITFTNKAAGELKERLNKTLGENAKGVWACTFHSACMRILRRFADIIGYSLDFTVYDALEAQKIVKQIMEDLNISENILSVKSAANLISKAKDKMLTPGEYKKHTTDNFRAEKVAQIYEKYQAKLKSLDAMDFDDLMLNTVLLFKKSKETLEYYQDKFKYIVIDEYQDTNMIQYEFAHMLSEKSRNLCVVGDDDQSIYKFRGATIENILNFEKNYPDAKTIRLEQNYRSTKSILNCANKLIENNANRKGKTLWTDNPSGEKVNVVTLSSDFEETDFIARTINDSIKNGYKYSDIAVLYRMNAQSNLIEKILIKNNIPYRIIGGHRFYDRAEIRDMMAYMHVAVNPYDDTRLLRIINQPRRGIGVATVDSLVELAEQKKQPIMKIIENAEKYSVCCKGSDKLRNFYNLVQQLSEIVKDNSLSLVERYELILSKINYIEYLKTNRDKESKLENIEELKSNIYNYEKAYPEEKSMKGFLQEVSLLTDADNYDKGSDCVVLMTMHSAKGLEFPIVFLPGFEEFIFPSLQSLMNKEETEEERRLAYVAITRAKEKLFITNTKKRILLGKTMMNEESRFLAELPEECIQRKTIHNEKKVISVFSINSLKQDINKEDTKVDLSNFMQPKLASEKGNKFSIGDKVSHKKFGFGNVVSSSDMGNDVMLEINFEKVGTKKLMANFAHVEHV